MMRILCGSSKAKFGRLRKYDLRFALYDDFVRNSNRPQGSAGNALLKKIQALKLSPDPYAWDLLSLALSVICADTAVQRKGSPDGWTREINLKVAVKDPDFWIEQRTLIEKQLKFLTTDIWAIEFTGYGLCPKPPKNMKLPNSDCVTLLSGGIDSLVGAIDLADSGKISYAVSQVANGDKQLQIDFAKKIGNGLEHMQLNHNVKCPPNTVNERSQRARSFIFLAYGVLAASSLKRYKDGDCVELYVCENGFISINPPLTPARIGSLSTRTTHPYFLKLFQELLNTAELRIDIKNPYQFKTKGEMLRECKNQAFLKKNAPKTTSCGRFARHNFTACGRCFPCLIRRAAFHEWVKTDRTKYVYKMNNKQDAGYDDVLCTALATSLVRAKGLEALATTNLHGLVMSDFEQYKSMLTRGFKEIDQFLKKKSVL